MHFLKMLLFHYIWHTYLVITRISTADSTSRRTMFSDVK